MKDITSQVVLGSTSLEELQPIIQCKCGAKFKPWEEVLGIYQDEPWECPQCGIKLYFERKLIVYEITDAVPANQSACNCYEPGRIVGTLEGTPCPIHGRSMSGGN